MLRTALTALLWLALTPLTLLRYLISRVRPGAITLRVELEGPHPHRVLPSSRLRPSGHGLSRWALRAVVRRAHRDKRIAAIEVRVGAMPGGWAELYELRQIILELKGTGKPVIAFVDHPDTRAMWVASAATELHIAPDVGWSALGIGAEMTFFGDALTNAGVDVEVLAAGTYKSALEPMIRVAPSPANREAMEALLDDLHQRVVHDLAEARGLPEADILDAFANAPLNPQEALRRGLVDGVSDEEALFDDHASDEAKRPVVLADDYRGRPSPWPRLKLRRPKLAMIEVRGAIRDGRHDEPMPQGASTQAVVRALEKARKSKRIRGVLLHIDSPGGSAQASERMFRAVRRLAKDKPVVAWMGNVAASGGYYIACGADTIVATPSTLTGSIGVIAARPSIGRLLGRLGIHRTRIERGPRATMYSLGRTLTDGERGALKAQISDIYDLFLRRVSDRRGQTREATLAVAEGRVWTGAQALENGLVDLLGGEATALTLLADQAGVTLGHEPRVQLIGPPRRRLAAFVRSFVGAEAPAALNQLKMLSESRALAWCPISLR
jgi:protease-4